MEIRDALPAEMAEVGEIRVTAYSAGGFMSAESSYAPTLRALGADGAGHVLVAVGPGHAPGTISRAAGDPGDAAGPARGAAAERQVAGTIMLQMWPQAGPVVTGPDEAEIRALAVLPGCQGRGVGRELLRRVIERAVRLGVAHLVLCTEPGMRTAHRLYEQAGFVRLPERDWSPAPGVTLLAYGLRLAR